MSELLKVSASAISTADPKDSGCFRRWYFQNFLKLPQLPMGSTTFGSVIHSVCELYLQADQNGMLNGKPVDLYPVGWERPMGRRGIREKFAITLEEQALIKSLIATAIEEGILMRVEGREIERKFENWEFMEGVTCKGFIDLLEPGAIRDHKSTKSMKWAKSIKPEAKNYLGDNLQLMLYAYWYYTEGGYDKELPLALSHQYYCKDPKKPHVEKREVVTTWEQVAKFMKERIAPVVEMMLAYQHVEKWDDIPLPDCPASACRKYGGCPFARICTNLETVEGYTERINRELTGVNSTDYKQLANELNQEGEKTMAESKMQKKIRLMREKQTGTVKKEEVTTPEDIKVAEQAIIADANEALPTTPEPPAAEQQRAPWHFQGCKACADSLILGLNTSGTPCRICDIMDKKTNVKSSSDFQWKVEEGKLVVMDGDAVVLESKVAEEPTAKEVVETVDTSTKEIVDISKIGMKPENPEEKPPQTPPTKTVVDPLHNNEELPMEQQEEGPDERGFMEDVEYDPKDLRGRFRILIGCVVSESKVKGGGKFGSPACRITSGELMIVVETEMSRILGTTKWAEMNTFAKKDAVQAMSEQIADALGGSTLVVSRLPKASLMEAVVLGISPYASEVVEPIAQ